MRYRDKSSGQIVNLEPSRSEFLVIGEQADTETAGAILTTRMFTLSPSSAGDNVFVVRLKSEIESESAVDKALQEMQADPAIKAVVPGLLDETGAVRFTLPGRVTVQLAGLADADAVALLDDHGSSVLRRYRTPGLLEVSVPEGKAIDEFIDALNREDAVQYAEPTFYAVDDSELRVQVSSGPATPGRSAESVGGPLQWHLEAIRCAEAWATTRGSPDIVIAVVDGLPDVSHTAFTGKLLLEPSPELMFSAPAELSSHATNVASVLAGEDERVVGVAPAVRLLPLVVNLNSQTYAERADAIRFAADAARRKEVAGVALTRLILSCSWRCRGDVAVIRNALIDAIEAGVVIVFSAGNDDTSAPHFPSEYASAGGPLGEGIMAVAATDRAGRKAPYSNYSPAVDLTAPGGDGLPFDERDIECADQRGGYVFAAGTSIAAPQVAAAAALVLSIDDTLTPAQVKDVLKSTASSRGTEPEYEGMLGAGQLDVAAAVAETSRRAAAAGPAPLPPAEEPGEDTGPSGGLAVRIATTSGASDAHAAVRSLREPLVALARAVAQQTGWSLTMAVVRKDGVETTIYLE